MAIYWFKNTSKGDKSEHLSCVIRKVSYVNNEGLDWFAHLNSLISATTVHEYTCIQQYNMILKMGS